MKYRPTAITVAIYFLFTLLFMTLFTKASEDKFIFELGNDITTELEQVDNDITTELEQDDLQPPDENQTNNLGLDNVNAQNVQQDDLQPLMNILNDANPHNLQEDELQTPVNTPSPFFKEGIFNPQFYQFLTLHDILIMRSTCTDFQKILSPNRVSMLMYGQLFLIKQCGKLNENFEQMCTMCFIVLQTQQLYDFLYFEKKESMNWFQNLDEDDKDDVLQLFSQSIQHYGGNINEDVVKDIQQKFGINRSQTQHLYEFLYLEKKESMDWFHNLDQDDKDDVLQLLSQSIQHYGGNINEDVVKDMEQKFGIHPSQTHQLYEFLYLEKNENKTNICELENINEQNPEQNVLQPPMYTMELLHSITKDILSKYVFNQFLTIRDILTLRKASKKFQVLLIPNYENNMVMFCKNFDGCKEIYDAVPLIWFDLKYFLNESYDNALEKMEMLNLQQNLFTILTRDGNIISWTNPQTQDLYQAIIVNKITNKIAQPSLDYNMLIIYNKCENELTKIINALTNKITIEPKKSFGGDLNLSNYVQLKLKNIKLIARNGGALAAILDYGRVVALGDEFYGGQIPDHVNILIQPHGKNIKAIFATNCAFAVLTHDGSVFAWGNHFFGGEIPEQIKTQLHQNVRMIFSNATSFVALLKNGDFVAWGREEYGGTITDEIQSQLKNVKSIFSSTGAFVALLNDGSVFAWGYRDGGGRIPHEIKIQLHQNVKTIFPQENGFKYLCNNGEIIEN